MLEIHVYFLGNCRSVLFRRGARVNSRLHSWPKRWAMTKRLAALSFCEVHGFISYNYFVFIWAPQKEYARTIASLEEALAKAQTEHEKTSLGHMATSARITEKLQAERDLLAAR